MEYIDNIEKATLENKYYRKVVSTTDQNQIVLMNIPPNGDIPLEVHPNISQFIRIESGNGTAFINDKKYDLYDGIALNIPAGSYHKIKNISDTKYLKLYTIYSPPEHSKDLVQPFQPKFIQPKFVKLKIDKNKSKIIYLLLL